MNSAFVVLASVALLAGCSKQSEKIVEHTVVRAQDVPSPVVSYSSPDEIRAEINQALSMAEEKDYRANIFYSFAHAYMGDAMVESATLEDEDSYLDEPLLNDLTRTLGDLGAQCLEDLEFHANEYNQVDARPVWNCGDLRNFRSAFGTFIEKQPVQILETQPCPSTYSGLCFSMNTFSHLSPRSVLREALALILRDAIRAKGKSEASAIHMQKAFGLYYDQNIDARTRDEIERQTSAALNAAQSYRDLAVKYLNSGSNNVLAWSYVGMFVAALKGLPELNSDLSLRVQFKTMDPLPERAYRYSALSILHDLGRTFQCSSSVQGSCGFDVTPIETQMSDPHFVSDLLEALNGIEGVVTNWTFLSEKQGKLDCGRYNRFTEPGKIEKHYTWPDAFGWVGSDGDHFDPDPVLCKN